MKPFQSYLISQAAFRNAEEYAEQADLLAERGWHGRALSLAILGQEEVGKGIYFALLSYGQMRFKPRAIQQMLRDHTAKQRMSQIHAVFESFQDNAVIVEFVREVVAPLVRYLQEVPEDQNADSEERIKAMLQELKVRADAWAAARPEIAETVKKELPNIREAVWIRTLDPLKFSGLYVDYDEASGLVCSPEGVPREKALAQRAALRTKLSAHRRNVPLIPDEASLERLRRLSGAPLTLEEQL